MAEMRRGDTPARTPQREALAAAIANHCEATDAVAQVQAAQDRLNADLHERLRPAARAARQVLEEARIDAPRRLTLALLDDGFPRQVDGFFPHSVADAETSLKNAERKVEEARQAKALLEEELTARQRHLHMAEHDLDAAVAAVVSSDPRKQELVDAFFRTGKQVLALAAELRTLKIVVTGVNDDDIGLALRLHDIAKPGSQGHHSAFTPDGAFAMALADLAEDPDAQLPELADLRVGWWSHGVAIPRDFLGRVGIGAGASRRQSVAKRL